MSFRNPSPTDATSRTAGRTVIHGAAGTTTTVPYPVTGLAPLGSGDEVWEDAAHVLVVTCQDGESVVVRLGVDDSMEYAVAPRRGSMDGPVPFHLQTR